MVDFRVEAQGRSLLERVRLNHAVLTNKYWYLPVDDKGHENYSPIGRGVKSSVFCGRWLGFSVCRNVAAHNGVSLGGLDCTNKVVVRHSHLWCNKSSCPVCFVRGWATRRARAMVGRLNEGVKRGFGKVEHVSVSVPVLARDLPEPVLRERCRMALVDRGVTGGCMIFHGFRESKDRTALVWSPHYHSLGFIEGGFDRCRDCVHDRDDCRDCSSGFKGREVRGFERDGYLVKVHDERRTVFGTSFYQLNHATIRLGIRRFQSVIWFGCCSYAKFKSEKEKVEGLCPVCDGEMGKSVYVGNRHIVKDIGNVLYVPCFVDDEFDVSGEPNYVDVMRHSG
jgi:hypothetical protein